jgi:CHAD domain-containing protein
MATKPKPHEAAAAAAAVTGAAAVGGKLAWDKASERRERDRARAYRLRPTEFVPDGMRRVERGQIELALENLDGQPKRNLDKAVHDTRKRLKRLRAALRLQRDAIGDAAYRRDNGAFRNLGRRLSGPRDAAVLVETLDALTERFADELAPEAGAALRERLVQSHEQALADLREDETRLEGARKQLRAARNRSAARTLEAEDFDALRSGLERIYRRGRKRMREAAADPTPENLHEWRKRTKDVWHAAQLVRPAAPKRMKRFAKQAHQLSDLLGDDHDLHVLQDQVGASDKPLLAAIDRRRAALQGRAFALGAKLYSQKPKRFARSIERGWRKRGGSARQPIAG